MFGATRHTRVAGVLVGYLADLVLADPRAGHPVAGFGAAATTVERLTYRDTRAGGAVHVAILVGAVSLLGAALQRQGRRCGQLGSVVVTAAATWVALGGTSLARVGSAMGELLGNGELDGARRLLPSLCGRDPALLDAAGLTCATVESIAENTSDAQVAPLLWAAAGGVPGVLGYRAINTLDAMIGHRSPRYTRFGWAAAKLDDAANYLAARVTAALTVVCAPIVGGSPSGAVTAWRRDAGRHPSPNAGVVEAAFAGALDVQLGGPTQYHYELQIRPALGAGPPPTVTDVRRAVRLSRAVQAAAALTLVGLSAAVRSGR
ncbi:MAG: cobalamin biosynthesis protein [Mycobacterium sp.]|uniref:cobalamin biosynthesis protein n=1 Tax=Mycobacterium sp. TaxID=1785 RepID=UPI003C763826